MPELSGATKSNREETGAVSGCQKEQLQQTAGQTLPALGREQAATSVITPAPRERSHWTVPTRPSGLRALRGDTGAGGAPRGLCRHPAASPGTGSGSFGFSGRTNLLHGNRDRPAALPSLVRDAQTCCCRTVPRNNYAGFCPSLGMHKSDSAGRTRNFRASLSVGGNSCFVPRSHGSGREVPVSDTCKLEIIDPHRQEPRNNKQILSAILLVSGFGKSLKEQTAGQKRFCFSLYSHSHCPNSQALLDSSTGEWRGQGISVYFCCSCIPEWM